jgi:hypothetical protein
LRTKVVYTYCDSVILILLGLARCCELHVLGLIPGKAVSCLVDVPQCPADVELSVRHPMLKTSAGGLGPYQAPAPAVHILISFSLLRNFFVPRPRR